MNTLCGTPVSFPWFVGGYKCRCLFSWLQKPHKVCHVMKGTPCTVSFTVTCVNKVTDKTRTKFMIGNFRRNYELSL